jgi:hypothetical protein
VVCTSIYCIMRLLRTDELSFKEFFDDLIPPYAILSHRWGDDEISYQELQTVIRGAAYDRNEASLLADERFAKIRSARTEASRQGYSYLWIDTCTINKESSAELSEAINSMYQRYAKSAVCFTYMSDVQWAGKPAEKETPSEDNIRQFTSSKWFTRGGTLQELLAPVKLQFFDRNWRYFGVKSGHLATAIASVTKIDPEYIRGFCGRGRYRIVPQEPCVA